MNLLISLEIKKSMRWTKFLSQISMEWIRKKKDGLTLNIQSHGECIQMNPDATLEHTWQLLHQYVIFNVQAKNVYWKDHKVLIKIIEEC